MPKSAFESGDNLARRQSAQSQINEWHPDLSRERPEWKTAHANEKDSNLDVTADGTYTVKAGDTLYDIAHRTLKFQNSTTGEATVKQEVEQIIQANIETHPELADNSDLLHTGEQLKLSIGDSSHYLNIPKLSTAKEQDERAAQNSPSPVLQQDNTRQSQPDLNPTPIERGPTLQLEVQQPYIEQDDNEYNPPQQPNHIQEINYYPDFDGTAPNQEAAKLSQIMVQDPHAAAAEMREQLSQLDPQSANSLSAQTKNYEQVGGLGDLQIQREFDQYGTTPDFATSPWRLKMASNKLPKFSHTRNSLMT